MARQLAEHTGADGVARLVEAERTWEQALDVVRGDVREMLRAANDEAERIAAAAAVAAANSVAARRRSLEHETAEAVKNLETDYAARVAHYDGAPDTLVDVAASRIASVAPWFESRGATP